MAMVTVAYATRQRCGGMVDVLVSGTSGSNVVELSLPSLILLEQSF